MGVVFWALWGFLCMSLWVCLIAVRIDNRGYERWVSVMDSRLEQLEKDFECLQSTPFSKGKK